VVRLRSDGSVKPDSIDFSLPAAAFAMLVIKMPARYCCRLMRFTQLVNATAPLPGMALSDDKELFLKP
jgi:hypothetical protein